MIDKKTRPNILAIDLGTSGPKVGIVSPQGKVLAHAFEEVELFIPSKGAAEQDPSQWWDKIQKCIQKIKSDGIVSLKSVGAINVTTQWHGTVPVDQNGTPLMNAVIWMDVRGKPHLDRIMDGLIKISGYEISKLAQWIYLTGGAPGQSGKDSIAHILFLKNEKPEIYQKTYKFLEPKDFLNLKLTGKFATSFETVTLHWLTNNRNINDIKYSDRLIRISGIDKNKLPDIKPTNDFLGTLLPEVAGSLDLPKTCKVFMGAPDFHTAVIGSGTARDFEGHMYLGSSSWISCHVPFKKLDIINQIATVPSAIPGRRMVVNVQESSGASLKFLKEKILLHNDELSSGNDNNEVFKIFDRLAASIPAGSGKLIFTPWIAGERTPVEDPWIRGGFHNLSIEHNRAHMIRAVLEGVAFNSKWLLKYVEKFIQRKMDTINIVGGGAISDLWCQILADILNRKIKRVKDPILANLRGAAFLASVKLGHLQYSEISDTIEIDRIFEPQQKNQKIYEALFNEYLNLYKANKAICARLNKMET